jgi:hypothetical protein
MRVASVSAFIRVVGNRYIDKYSGPFVFRPKVGFSMSVVLEK